jgi:hypothetical protein
MNCSYLFYEVSSNLVWDFREFFAQIPSMRCPGYLQIPQNSDREKTTSMKVAGFAQYILLSKFIYSRLFGRSVDCSGSSSRAYVHLVYRRDTLAGC